MTQSEIPDNDQAAHPGSRWDQLLIGLLAFTGAYALALVVAGALVGEQVFDRLGFGPTNGTVIETSQLDYIRFMYGVLGSVIVGWMVLLGAVARGPFRRRERWSWWALLSSVLVWFVLDTTTSIALGWHTHAAFNVPFAAALATPIVALRPLFGFGHSNDTARTDPRLA